MTAPDQPDFDRFHNDPEFHAAVLTIAPRLKEHKVWDFMAVAILIASDLFPTVEQVAAQRLRQADMAARMMAGLPASRWF